MEKVVHASKSFRGALAHAFIGIALASFGCRQKSEEPSKKLVSTTNQPQLPTVRVADMAHVDPQELIAQARALAIGHNPRVVLTQIHTRGRGVVRSGLVDLTDGSEIVYEFYYLYLDAARPPGKDKVEGWVSVVATSSGFLTKNRPGWSSSDMGEPTNPFQGVPDPKCSVRDAWRTVVRSGVPDNAIASILWQPPRIWTFRVDGHPELGRRVDSATCELFKDDGGAEVPATRPPTTVPAPQSPNPCGCEKDDRRCALQCARMK